jgi:hypothetical protein
MVPSEALRAAGASSPNRPQPVECDQLDRLVNSKRSARRQYLAKRIHDCGPRATFEAFLELEAGRTLDDVLAAFGRLDPKIVHALGADVLAIDTVCVIDGGAS